ncbi:unnamed protein product [Acanthosepion pharaonis]|uniref:Fibronectin type-III domain-containing protein n=1 Tax=Acanthosepion pharaonis TaxID=158019 RepID=A0A812D722_ACAPH|nr:unnamed protein product [Sepia pharaonis]
MRLHKLSFAQSRRKVSHRTPLEEPGFCPKINNYFLPAFFQHNLSACLVQATMSAVEKVAANAAFSSSSSIGQTNRKSGHILSRVTPNPSPAESDLSHNSSDGNSEFEEALKNIKALNGQSRYSDNEAEEKSTSPSSAEKSSTDKNVFDMKLTSEENNTPDSLSSNYTKKSETPVDSESVSKLKTNLGNLFSKTYSGSIVDKQQKVFCEDADSDSNELTCDKADLLKDKKDPGKDKSSHLNHLNSPFEKSVNQAIQGNGDHCKTESVVSHLGSAEKIRDSFKSFLQKNSYNKMLLKKKDDTNVQSVTSTSDSQSVSKLSKTSSVRGNLFENFESIASPETEAKNYDDDDEGEEEEDSRQKEETIDCKTKSNGQAESKISSATLKSEKNNLDNKIVASDSPSEETTETNTVNNFCDKEQKLSNHSSQSDGMKSNSKSSSLHLDASPQLSPISNRESDGNSEKSSKSPKEILDNCNNLETNPSKKRPAELDENVSNSDCKDEEMAPVKRSRLDDMIGNLGSRIGIKLDSIPFVDELEESSKDSDSSEKPSEDTASTDEEDDAEKAADLDQKIIRMTEKELAEIVKREVEKILNSKETDLQSLQQKIDELQAANESWKTQANELHKQVLEQSVMQQKSEKRKMTVAHKTHSTRHVGIQVDEGKILPSTNPSRSGQMNNQINTPPVTKFQSPTVKSLLDASRNSSLNQVSSSPAVVYQSSPGLFVVSSPASTTTSTAHSILTKPVSSHISTPQAATSRSSGSVKVIDLTGDDENSLTNQSNGKNLVHAAAIAPIGQVRPGIVPQQVVRQVTPVQQQPVPPGTSFLLSTPAGTQIISPTVTQALGSTRPGVCQYVLTSTPNIRPGSLVTVVPTQGTQNSSIRPPIVSSTIASASSLPQLRPAQQSSSVASVDLTKGIRPPPPLQSAPVSQRVVSTILSSSSSSQSLTSVAKHPAALPPTPSHNVQAQGLKSPPPKPGLRITRVAQGIVLSWNMTLAESHAEISNYQLYAYQEGSASPSTSLWKKVGDIKALPLPMACTLTQFHEGNKYHFAVRAVDAHGRVGPFSDPNTINLGVGGK